MIVNPFDAFIGSRTPVPMYAKSDTPSSKPFAYLLWGDGVRLLDSPLTNGRRHVQARGKKGWIKPDVFNCESLLEFYFIDVGQGDGVLIKTPDFRHLLVDGGFPRAKQPSGKAAADFVDWKFVKDYGLDTITLDVMMSSHNDEDHYGGLSDLLDVAQSEELDANHVRIEQFFHSGVCWWKTADKDRTLGELGDDGDHTFLVDLIDDRDSAVEGLAGVDGRRLQGEWAKFIRRVSEAEATDGSPTTFARLSDETPYLPGFEPGANDVVIRVLAPIEFTVDGQPGVLNLGADSQNTNGHSIMMRVDYGRTRTLLTGDLNKAAQQTILEQLAGSLLELQCDVAKACHHGSADVSLAFLQAMAPSATIISSGDAEGHDHPRPAIVAASGATGHLTVKDDEILTPLVYSTELARSYAVGKLSAILSNDDEDSALELESTILRYSERKAGAITAKKGSRKAAGSYIVSGLVYGLVNVRTDGETILAATMDEKSAKWSVRTFPARF